MITAEQLAATLDVVRQLGVGEPALNELRARMPGTRFVACSDDDVPPRLRPAAECEGAALYYIGSGEHCLALSSDAETAIGLVIASVQADDD